jgi:hypothetical protein
MRSLVFGHHQLGQLAQPRRHCTAIKLSTILPLLTKEGVGGVINQLNKTPFFNHPQFLLEKVGRIFS